jgi:hypothetical protein
VCPRSRTRIPRQLGDDVRDGLRVLAPQRFPREDDGARVDLVGWIFASAYAASMISPTARSSMRCSSWYGVSATGDW